MSTSQAMDEAASYGLTVAQYVELEHTYYEMCHRSPRTFDELVRVVLCGDCL